jgi:uncharacterized protein (TIGR03435 family)
MPLVVVTLAFSQSAPATSPKAPVRSVAFEVVSIRPSKPGTYRSYKWRTTPDGYRVTGQSMLTTFMIAYFPQTMLFGSKDRLSGAPSWLNDQYDIVAKVSEADLAEWQKQGVTVDKEPMLRQMLQNMLADRCNLVAHMVPGPPIPGFSLELGKHGRRPPESKPGEAYPAGNPLPAGGVFVPPQPGERQKLSFYGVTMTDFTALLLLFGHPIQDNTGLIGHYDIVLNWIDDLNSELPPGAIDTSDPDPLSHYDLEAVGLHVRPIKIPADTLVIDHIEKPSEN